MLTIQTGYQTGNGSDVLASISLYNYYNATNVGPVTFSVWATPVGSPTAAPILVTTFSHDINLAPVSNSHGFSDGFTSENFQQDISVPAGLVAGDYYLSIQADPDAVNADSYTSFGSSSILTVAQDGSVAIKPIFGVYAQLSNVQVSNGSDISATVGVYNSSSIADVGQVNFDISITQVRGVYVDFGGQFPFGHMEYDPLVQADPSATVTVASFSRDVNLANDFNFQETFSLPAGLAPGDYFLKIQAAPADSSAFYTPWSGYSYDRRDLLTVGQDGTVTVSQVPWSEPICGGVEIPIFCPLELGTRIILNAPDPSTGANPPSDANGTTNVNPPDVALNLSPATAGLALASAASGTAGALVNLSAPALSALAGAPVLTNTQSPSANPLIREVILTDDQSSATASGEVVDLLASASSDNTDADSGPFYHAGHGTLHTPINTRA